MKSLFFSSMLASMLFLCAAQTVSAQQDTGSFSVKLVDPVPVPGTQLTIELGQSDLSALKITDTGIIYFLAPEFSDGFFPDGAGLYSLSGSNQDQLRRLAHEQQPTPLLDGRIRSFERFTVANDGSAYFHATLEDVTAFGTEAVYKVDQNNQLIELFREEKVLFDGGPILCGPTGIRTVRWNSSGTTAAVLNVEPVDGGNCRERLYSISPNGNFTELARERETQLPFGSIDNEIRGISNLYLGIGANGEITFVASTTDNASDLLVVDNQSFQRIHRFESGSTSVFHTASGSIFVAFSDSFGMEAKLSKFNLATGELTTLMQGGDILPNSDGAFLDISRASVNSDGQALILADLTATPGGNSDSEGLYLFTENSIIEIARRGHPIRGTNQIIRTFFRSGLFGLGSRVNPSINDGGRVLFEVRREQNGEDEIVVLYYDADTEIVEFLNSGTIVGGEPVLGWRMPVELNASGTGPMLARFSGNPASLVTYQAPESSGQPGPAPNPVPPSRRFLQSEGQWVVDEEALRGAGQGFTFDVLDSFNLLFVAWFTYGLDPVVPDDSVPDDIGAEGQRWLTAQLQIEDNTATGGIFSTAGGQFDSSRTSFQTTRQVGTMTIELTACDQGTMTYVIDEPPLTRTFPIIPLERRANSEFFCFD